MKKRILILIILLLFTTGCTCEYDLTIDGNKYMETITFTAESPSENNSFNKNWNIPVDEDLFNNPGDPDSNTKMENIYNYNISNNKLTFNYDFSSYNIENSTAVSKCYNKLTVSNYNDTTIISTSPKAKCFEENPPLTKVKVKITVDRPVISNNADSINGNTYIWNISKNNANDKSINIILDNSNIDQNIVNNPNNNNNIEGIINKYAIYIFFIIIGVIVYCGYKWFMEFKEKNNNID